MTEITADDIDILNEAFLAAYQAIPAHAKGRVVLSVRLHGAPTQLIYSPEPLEDGK